MSTPVATTNTITINKLPTAICTPPFSHLNLRFNPFGELNPEDRAKVAVADYQLWLDKFLQNQPFILQFSGDCGRGKSTHLHGLKLHLQEHFPNALYIYYPEDEVVRKLPPEGSLLFLDETQRIPKRLRNKLWQRQCSFVIATHEDHSAEFSKHGREFEHVVLQGINVEKLRQVLEAKLELARRTSKPIPTFTDESLKKLIDQFDDDLRGMEHHLYDVFQNLKEIGHVTII